MLPATILILNITNQPLLEIFTDGRTDTIRGSLAPSEISAASFECVYEVDSQRSPDQSPEQRKDRLFRLANELLMTERSYVTVLYLIDQVLLFLSIFFLFFSVVKWIL